MRSPCRSRFRSALLLLLPLLGGTLLLARSATAPAAPSAAFHVSAFAELNKGEPQGAFISSRGEVVAGREAKRLEVGATMIWSSARDQDGTVYFGTGDEGLLLAVKNSVVRRVADLKTVLVTALAIGPEGKVLAGTMPGAKILEVDPKRGTWRQLARLPAEHVWALVWDDRARTIYAASGSPGKIFAIPAGGGTPRVHFDPEEKHLLCLARQPGGALLAGSADKAILYRVTGPGKGTALHDFDATELKDVAIAPGGTIYLAVNRFEKKSSGLPRFDRSEAGEEGTPIKATKPASKTKAKVRPQELRPGAKTGKGAIFAIDPSGRVDSLYQLEKGYLTALQLDTAGVLWAGDGSEGKVYLVHPDRTVLTAFDLPERQVLAPAVAGPELYLGTGDAGALYRISARPVAQPRYLSQVLDAKFHSRWGRIHVQASEMVRVESRSGNTAKPDKVWSDWRPAQAQGRTAALLVSPPARYLQVRLGWKGQQGYLRSFTVYYLPQNQRTEVSEISVEGASKDKGHTPKLKIKWKAENPDGDTLVYRVYYREELGLSWRLASGPEPLEKAELEWDTEPIPDGYYRLKVTASDERDNPEEVTLVDSLISERLLLDNRKPEIAGLTVRQPWVTGLARDSYSTIKRIEFSVDGGPWRMVGPLDGIFDSSAEAFRFRLPEGLAAGAHVIAVRALDEADNLGVSQARFIR